MEGTIIYVFVNDSLIKLALPSRIFKLAMFYFIVN